MIAYCIVVAKNKIKRGNYLCASPIIHFCILFQSFPYVYIIVITIKLKFTHSGFSEPGTEVGMQ